MYRRPATVLLCAFAVSCGGESGPNGVEVGALVVSPTPVALAQQGSQQLQVSVLDPDGALLTGIPVTFASADIAIVTVSNVGLVQSVGPAGASTLTVRAGDASVQVPVTVGATGNTIRILPGTPAIPQLASVQLDVALLDLVGTPIAGTVFSYASSDPGILAVTPAGLVTSVGRHGQVAISATHGALTAQVQITVTQVATSIALNPNPVVMIRNSARPLAAQVLDAVGSPIVGAALTYSASPASLASVSAGGVLTSFGNLGSGTATATAGPLTTSVPISVIDVGALTGSIVETVAAGGAPYGVALAADGTVYGVGTAGVLHKGSFDASAVQSFTISNTLTIGIGIHPSSGLIYVTGSNGDALMEIAPATGNVLRRWASAEQIFDLAFSADGQHIYVAGDGGRLSVISAATMTQVKQIPINGPVVHLVAHPSQPLVYASGVGVAREVNVQSGAIRTWTLDAAQASSIALGNDRLFVVGEGGAFATITLASGDLVETSVPGCPMYDIATAPNGLSLVVTCTGSASARILDAQTLAVIGTIPTGGRPRRIAIALDGLTAVIANDAGWYDHVR